ncbi:unnamed protein product [Acanthoscelides obtectus]|uniref:DDE Tnp4 domain-containing protein n=1 Tax=Acanthoscelides obtectus TaxID=200917 RepID=A0A9P0KTA6_ACAOB|nr:unnamed protein product [Acanthoscelides obtectus]CAK1672122.1 hypothetical protein AOBTE_LOCUS28660 [Acanthoscelides obtectus]
MNKKTTEIASAKSESAKMVFPDTSAKWKELANLFEERWNFPHCLGAIDGKHIDIIPPADSGSYYYNYKGRHSMVLMAIVDARY